LAPSRRCSPFSAVFRNVLVSTVEDKLFPLFQNLVSAHRTRSRDERNQTGYHPRFVRVNDTYRAMSYHIRNVPYFATLEMSPFC
jgi:hypothetical protein